MIPLPTPGQAFKSYLLILTLFFSASFLAGSIAPALVREDATDAFQLLADTFRGLDGGKLFFTLLVHNVMASILILLIPALLLAASYGLWLGVAVVRRIRGRESTLLRVHIGHAFRRYFAVVFPLLVVAAGIETGLILWLQ